jgi:hypothetical protein
MPNQTKAIEQDNKVNEIEGSTATYTVENNQDEHGEATAKAKGKGKPEPILVDAWKAKIDEKDPLKLEIALGKREVQFKPSELDSIYPNYRFIVKKCKYKDTNDLYLSIEVNDLGKQGKTIAEISVSLNELDSAIKSLAGKGVYFTIPQFNEFVREITKNFYNFDYIEVTDDIDTIYEKIISDIEKHEKLLCQPTDSKYYDILPEDFKNYVEAELKAYTYNDVDLRRKLLKHGYIVCNKEEITRVASVIEEDGKRTSKRVVSFLVK